MDPRRRGRALSTVALAPSGTLFFGEGSAKSSKRGSWRLAAFASVGTSRRRGPPRHDLPRRRFPRPYPTSSKSIDSGAALYRGPVGETSYVRTDSRHPPASPCGAFVEDTRELSSDLAVVKRNWLDAYTLVTPRRGNMLSAFVQKPENDPFRRARKTKRVTMEFLSAVRVARGTPGSSIGARARGTRAATGAWAVTPPGARCCAPLVTAPKTAEAMSKNPIGLRIDEFHWRQGRR